jgi:hypothetical protein
MKMSRLFYQMLLALIGIYSLQSCNNVGSSKQKLSTASFISVNADTLNKRIAEGYEYREGWTTTPLLITSHLFDPEYDVAAKQHYSYDEMENEDGSLTVTVTQEGLLNTTIYGEKIQLIFTYEDDLWVIKSMKKAYKCQKGKGGNDYCGTPCK